MTATQFITYCVDFFVSMVNAFLNVFDAFNTPIVEDIGSLHFEGTWLGDKIVEFWTAIIGDATYIDLMFGAGLSIIIIVTVIKWIIGIIT